ncbi:MAG: hypothetical protein COS84_06805 [Armatimonadetes bacterium CG07_land_8_20_14_0_80_40_9]|nr:MAG: hypothetical protein COS84_06805 [Armatimonadetes bacterium CG07_land_8_20_14_0_80_40_9]
MSVSEIEVLDKIFEESEKNRLWLKKEYDRLVEEYKDKFVAVWSQQIIDYDNDYRNLLNKVPKEYKGKGLLIEYLTKERIEFVL